MFNPETRGSDTREAQVPIDLRREGSIGDQKVLEYVQRAQEGESLNKIFDGLPSVFRSGIAERLLADPTTIDDIKIRLEELGYSKALASEETSDDKLDDMVKQAIGQFSHPSVKALYEQLYENRNDPGQRKVLVEALFKAKYKQYREVEYPMDKNEKVVWEGAVQDDKVPHKEENDWMYRGLFPSREKGESTKTRASLNVRVTSELINELDTLIEEGVLVGNYKFGSPDTKASSTERHDSISIYFLEEPNEEVLSKIAQVARPYVRGDNLLGKKIADGLYLSEVGSVQDEHINDLEEQLDLIDLEFAQAVKEYTIRKKGGKGMSEAQFYAIKDVADAFGYEINYDEQDGFVVQIMKK